MVFLLFILFINNIEAQKTKNEIKLNLAYVPLSAFNKFYNIDYQRILHLNHAVGVSFGGAFKFNSEVGTELGFIGVFHDIVLVPYYRYYPFSKIAKPATGFFVEGNLFFSYFPHTSQNMFGETFDKTKGKDAFHRGAGLGIGYKSLTSKNFVWEFLLGFGGNTLNGYPRLGILFGKRF